MYWLRSKFFYIRKLAIQFWREYVHYEKLKSLHCQTQTRYQIFSWLAFLHFQVFWHTKYIFFRIDKYTFVNNSQVLQFSNTPSFYVCLVSNFSRVDFQHRLSINDHFISQLISVKDNAYDNISTLEIFIFPLIWMEY